MAERARDEIETIDGQRAFVKAMAESDDAMREVLDAVGVERETPLCPTCRQAWEQGNVKYVFTFADDSILTYTMNPRLP